MEIDFSEEILDLAGNVLVNDNLPLTLGRVAMEALQAPHQDEKNISAELKLARFFLAMEIHKATEAKKPIEITVEQASTIKTLANKLFSVLVYGRVHQIMEGLGQK